MTQYALSDLQITLRDTARRYAEEVLAPAAMKADRAGTDFPADVLLDMGNHGYLGLDIPAEYGGQGFDTLTCAALLEVLAGGWFSSTVYALNLATGPILAAGSEAQKRRYLPDICAGRTLPAFVLTEPGGGSDAAAITTHARLDGDAWVLNGQKILITNANRAAVLVVFARTAKEAPRGQGISIFLIDAGTPGLAIGQRFHAIAHSANSIWEVTFDDCRIPRDHLIGREGEGFSYIQRDFAKVRAVYGSRCVGVAQAALDYALQYAVERKQFGQTIASFQGIRFKVAELVARIEAARQLSYRAAVLADARHADAPVAASMAKMVASQLAVETTGEAMQLMGGHGLLKDHPLERYYREAKLFQVGDGTSEVLKLLVSRFANRKAGDRQSAQLG